MDASARHLSNPDIVAPQAFLDAGNVPMSWNKIASDRIIDQSLFSAVYELANVGILLTRKTTPGVTDWSIEDFPLCSIYSCGFSPVFHPQSFAFSCYRNTIAWSIHLQRYCAILAL